MGLPINLNPRTVLFVCDEGCATPDWQQLQLYIRSVSPPLERTFVHWRHNGVHSGGKGSSMGGTFIWSAPKTNGVRWKVLGARMFTGVPWGHPLESCFDAWRVTSSAVFVFFLFFSHASELTNIFYSIHMVLYIYILSFHTYILNIFSYIYLYYTWISYKYSKVWQADRCSSCYFFSRWKSKHLSDLQACKNIFYCYERTCLPGVCCFEACLFFVGFFFFF